MKFRERLRAFELMLQARMKEFRCSVHLCIGQEDVPEALHDLLRPADWLFSTHRNHGHYLAKGGDPERLLAEIEGREEGINGGFSGSQSFADPALRFHSTAIVGGLCTAAAGVALAMKLRGENAIAVCCVGDGATEQGGFWEALSFSSLHRLPLLWICENNGLSVHAPLSARQPAPILPRVASFGVRVLKGVDGLRTALRFREDLPAFVEVPCERRCAHVSAMEDLRE